MKAYYLIDPDRNLTKGPYESLGAIKGQATWYQAHGHKVLIMECNLSSVYEYKNKELIELPNWKVIYGE
jgi:hypothetical protein